MRPMTKGASNSFIHLYCNLTRQPVGKVQLLYAFHVSGNWSHAEACLKLTTLFGPFGETV